MKWRLLEVLFIAAIVVAVFYFFPIFGTTAVLGVQTKSLINAKQLATGVKFFAIDHDGRFPMHLNELEDYLPAGVLEASLYPPNEKGKTYPVRCDWLYFGAFHDEQHPPTILIASPQAFTEDRKSKRIVVYGDTSGEILNDEDFRPKLRQTIKELNERAAALMPKPAANEAPKLAPQ